MWKCHTKQKSSPLQYKLLYSYKNATDAEGINSDIKERPILMSMLCVNITFFSMHGHKFVIFENIFCVLLVSEKLYAHNKLPILLGVCCFL